MNFVNISATFVWSSSDVGIGDFSFFSNSECASFTNISAAFEESSSRLGHADSGAVFSSTGYLRFANISAAFEKSSSLVGNFSADSDAVDSDESAGNFFSASEASGLDVGVGDVDKIIFSIILL